MNISAVTSSAPADAVSASTAKTAAPVAAAPKQDSVQLSPQAQAAAKGGGDVDHDGDSH